MNKPTYTEAECCGSCYWFETHERYNLHTGVEEMSWLCCTRDPEVDESTVATMVCEAYMPLRSQK